MIARIVRAYGSDDLKKQIIPQSPQSANPPDGSMEFNEALQYTTGVSDAPSGGIGVDHPSSQKQEHRVEHTSFPWLH